MCMEDDHMNVSKRQAKPPGWVVAMVVIGWSTSVMGLVLFAMGVI